MGLQVNIYKGCTKGKVWPFIMHPALLGTDLSIPPPVNNLTSLASDFNWVEEMALLTRQGLSGAAVEVIATIQCHCSA